MSNNENTSDMSEVFVASAFVETTARQAIKYLLAETAGALIEFGQGYV